MRVLDLFAGAGGFTLACEMAGGYKTIAFCEIDSYAQKVLAKNWPDVPIFSDVTKLKADDIAGTVDVITGGFPCQDLSAAGAGAGIGEGTRSGLFREMLRIAHELQVKQGFLPYIVFENVPRLLSGPSEDPGQWFGEFLWSLAEIGYDAEWFCISAASVGAPHLRERVCVVAYANESECADATGTAQLQRAVLEKTGREEASDGLEALSLRTFTPYTNQTPIERGGISRRVYQKHAEIVANTPSIGQSGQGVYEARISSASSGDWKTTYAFTGGIGTIWETEPTVGRVADGIPNQPHRLGMMGNAIVPQVFQIVMEALRESI